MTTSPEDSPIRVGNRYRLDERIGAGAMGAVWRATDELLNRTVAVKELLAAAAPPTAAGGDALEESRQRILREGRIGARLQHAHVISMFDVVVHDDRPWLVMEYLPSKSLATVVAEFGPLAPGEVAEIGRHVADGLAAAHAAGVVHRDVKPGNVLIADDGRVKLTDFGVSKAVDDVQLTRTGLIAGTPAFLSPEVARGQVPTSASDVFALGATLFAAVEGRPPFGLDENAYALLHKVATGAVQPPEHAGPLTPVIMWLLSPDPDDRPTATEARDVLGAVAADSGRERREGGSGTAVLAAPGRPTTPGAPTAFPGSVEPGRPASGRRAEPAPAAPPGPARSAADPADSASRRRRTPVGAVLAALVVLLVGGITAAVLLGGGSADPGAQAAPAPVDPGPTTIAPATTAPATTAPATSAPPSSSPTSATPAPAPTSVPTATPEPTGVPAPAGSDPVAFVQRYYSLLPGDTDAAFALLGPSAQAKSNGRGGFDAFYGGLSSVSVRNLRRVDDATVTATVVFVGRDGRTSSEPYRFVMATGADGGTIMESFSQA